MLAFKLFLRLSYTDLYIFEGGAANSFEYWTQHLSHGSLLIVTWLHKHLTVIYLKGETTNYCLWQLHIRCSLCVSSREGSVSKLCTSGGRQCTTVPIPGLRVLAHPNQTWTFPVNDILKKSPQICNRSDKSVLFLQISGLFPLF